MSDLAVCLSLSVSLLIYLSPSLPLKYSTYSISLPPCLVAPPPLRPPLPHFLYPIPFPFSLSMYTPIHPYFHAPILFTPPVMVIKPQFGTVMGICTFDKKNEATCAIQGNLVLSVCNSCHVSLSVFMDGSYGVVCSVSYDIQQTIYI